MQYVTTSKQEPFQLLYELYLMYFIYFAMYFY